MESENSQNSPKFDREWVQVLINLKMKYSKWFTGQRNLAAEGWKLIFDELKTIGAPPHITILKLKKKWMNLMTRYKQIKNNTLNSNKITWPYYEQIDRAFGKNYPTFGNIDEKKLNYEDKQDFIKNLIKFRCEYKHLFTGKKYTAVEGWKVIIKLLDCEKSYSVQQINKCWQNLVQKYKQILKNDNKQVWLYFDDMHKWFQEDGNSTEDNNELPDDFDKSCHCACIESKLEILRFLKEIKQNNEEIKNLLQDIKNLVIYN